MTASTVTPVVGFSKLNEWATVAHNQSGSLVMSFAIQGEGANNLGKDLVDQLKQFAPFSAEDLHQGLLDMLAQVRQTNCAIQFACSLLRPEKVVFGSFGGSVTLKKATRVQELIGGSDQLQLIEGRRGDYIIVLATEAAADYLPEISERLLQNYQVETISAALIRSVQDQSDASQLAIAFVECAADDSSMAANLLAQASAEAPAVRPETLPTPNVSVESIEGDGYEEEQTLSGRPISVGLPSRPSKFQRLGRDLGQTLMSASKKVSHFAILQLPKIKLLLGASARQTGKLAAKLPVLHQHYQRADEVTKRKIWIVIIGTLLLLTAAVGASMWRAREQSRLTKQYNQAIVAPLALKAEASEIAHSDPIVAREKSAQVVEQLEALVPQFAKNRHLNDKLAAEISSAKTFATDISGQLELSEPQVFFDLRLTDNSFVASEVTAVENKLFFLDKEKRQVVVLDTTSKQSNVVNFTAETVPVDWAATNTDFYLLGNGIHQYNLESKKLTNLKEAGDSDRDGISLKMFGDYLYILNPVKRNIFRFTLEKDGLSQGIGWIANKKDLDFDQVFDMAVDGSIWLTTKTGEIKKYTQGQPESFAIEGLETAFNSPLIISTSVNQSHLFLLEPNQRRLVVLTKDGKLVKEVRSAALGAASSIVATDAQTAAYVLSGSTVYTIPLTSS